MTVNPFGRHETIALGQIPFARKHKIRRDDPIFKDLLGAVHVPDKGIQGIHPLDQAFFQKSEILR